MDKTAQKSDLRSKFRRIFWRLFALGLFLMVLMFVGISMGWIGYLPPLEELQNPKNKYAIVVGNEVKGVEQQAINMCNQAIEIPQFGTKHSLNVSIATGIVMWEIFKKISTFDHHKL